MEEAKSNVPPLGPLLNNLNPLPSAIFLATLSLTFIGTSLTSAGLKKPLEQPEKKSKIKKKVIEKIFMKIIYHTKSTCFIEFQQKKALICCKLATLVKIIV